MTSSLILKRAPVGDNPEDYSVLEEGVVVGRIFKSQVAPEGCPWMWGRAGTAGASSAQRTAMSRRARLRWQRSPRAGDGE